MKTMEYNTQENLKNKDFEGFKVGTYEHYSGTKHVVFALSHDSISLEPLVHHYDISTNMCWTSTLENFQGRIYDETRKDIRAFTFICLCSPAEFLSAIRAAT